MPFYLYGEDLAEGLVGPFKTRIDAEKHLAFQEGRGDEAATNGTSKILTESEAQVLEVWFENRCTPEADKKMEVQQSPIDVDTLTSADVRRLSNEDLQAIIEMCWKELRSTRRGRRGLAVENDIGFKIACGLLPSAREELIKVLKRTLK